VVTALLFERDSVEELDDWSEIPRLGRSSLLWIDLEGAHEAEASRVADELELREESRASLLELPDTPVLSDYRDYIEVTVCAPSDDREHTLVAMTCLVSEKWIVTAHERPLAVLETFRERASASGDTGRLDGPEFLANVLEWVFESYFESFEDVELVLEEIDTTSMSGEVKSKDQVLSRLVEVRREIGRLRRALTSHREVILSLTRPELEAITSSAAAERFATLRRRLDDAAQAARDSRDSVVGSFDIVLANTGQRTNEIMKVLTLASVLILPGTLLAGIMGMNFKLGLFANQLYFWLVVAAMVVIAVATLAIARKRQWI
jgi:magnesium transporter